MSSLLKHLLEMLEAFQRAGIRHAAVGGIAVVAHGVVRATADLDFLVSLTDAASLDTCMQRLGFRSLHASRDAANYVRDGLRVDFLFASRPIALRLLESAQARKLAGHALPVVSVAGLIGLKLQALVNDPRRQQDAVDIRSLLRLHREQLDLDEVEEYFALFDRTQLLADWLAELDETTDDENA